MPKSQRCTELEYESRIELISELLVRPGIPKRRQFILQYVAKKTDWNVCTKQIDNYIAEATKRLKATPIDRELELIKLYNGYEFLEKKNLEIEDYKEVRAIWESKAKLFGLNEAEKVDYTISAKFDITKLYNSEDIGKVEKTGE